MTKANKHNIKKLIPICALMMSCGVHPQNRFKSIGTATPHSGFQDTQPSGGQDSKVDASATAFRVQPARYASIKLSKSRTLLPRPAADLEFMLAIDLDMSQPMTLTNGQPTSDMQFLFASKRAEDRHFEPKGATTDHFRIAAMADLKSLEKPYDIEGRKILLTGEHGVIEIGRFLSPVKDQELFTLLHPVLCEEEYAKVCQISLQTTESDTLLVSGEVVIETLSDKKRYISKF